MKHSLPLTVACLLASTSFLQAGAIATDLSGDNLNPTDLGVFQIGSNTVSGSVVNARGVTGGGEPLADVDVFTFTIESGTQLDSLNVDAFQGGGPAFIGIAEGATFPFDFAGLDGLSANGGTDEFLGLTLFESTSGDILPALADGSNPLVTGFTAPLGAGQYTVYIQETNTTVPDSFDLAFSVSAVPEPSTAILAGLSILGLAVRRRRVSAL